MDKINKQDFNNILKDVRKAYRLLYLYQQRLLDLIQYIANQFNRQFEEGWSKYSNGTVNGKRANINSWAWDWLNMYLYEFNLGRKDVNSDKIFFTIVLQSDTGFFDADIDSRIDVTKFADSANSETRLIFVVVKNGYGCPIENLLGNKLNKKTTEFENKKDEGEIWIGKAYNLLNFIDEKSTNQIIDDFHIYCKDKIGIEMKETITKEN